VTRLGMEHHGWKQTGHQIALSGRSSTGGPTGEIMPKAAITAPKQLTYQQGKVTEGISRHDSNETYCRHQSYKFSPKRMIFKFMGGPFDGKLVVGESGKEKEARRYYSLTDHGRVGQRFHTASEYAIELLPRSDSRKKSRIIFNRYVYEVR